MKKTLMILAIILLFCGIIYAQDNNYQNFFDFSNQNDNYYVPDDSEANTDYEYTDDNLANTLPDKYTMIDEGLYTPVRDNGDYINIGNLQLYGYRLS